MSYVDLVDETICALITTPGLSGISVIRVSGPAALTILKRFCTFLPDQPESHKIYFGVFKSVAGEWIDEALVSYFARGRSFTGDETLEISVHGGFASSNRVLAELMSAGCRAAERGEFSFRAFYNDKLDLVQAEAVLGIIHSRSDQARSVAIQQLKGRTSEKFEKIENSLLSVLAQLEASIDFSTEDIEPYSLDKIETLVRETKNECDQLLAGFKKGKMISQGLNVVLVGEPNVGKSSLYNAILGEDKAIISAQPGTTRDLLPTNYKESGMPIQLIDSAGLRETHEEIEQIGIEKTRRQMEESDLIFFVLDSKKFSEWDLSLIQKYSHKTVFVLSKVDLVADQNVFMSNAKEKLEQALRIHMTTQAPLQVIGTSVKNSIGIQSLRDVMDKMSLVDIDRDEALITQHRHFDGLTSCSLHLSDALHIFSQGGSYDLLALEIQCSLKEIYALLGKEFNEQVLDMVFKQFCIGK